MSSRARKPSSKAVEIARSHQHSPAPVKKPAASKAKARKGNQAKSSSAKTSNAQRADAADGDNGPAANRLYCICLGTDDGTPMIQCEGCENWYVFSLYMLCSASPVLIIACRFHFRCMDMDPHAAGRIQAYYCEICTEVGAGVTQCESLLSLSSTLLFFLFSALSDTPGPSSTGLSKSTRRRGGYTTMVWVSTHNQTVSLPNTSLYVCLCKEKALCWTIEMLLPVLRDPPTRSASIHPAAFQHCHTAQHRMRQQAERA